MSLKNTIRARVKRMREAGILEIAGPGGSFRHSRAQYSHYWCQALKQRISFQKGLEFSKLKGVVSVAVVNRTFTI